VQQLQKQRRLVSLVFTLILFTANSGSAELPPENTCSTAASGAHGEGETDASTPRLREGMILALNDLLALRSLIPEEVWEQHEVFFYEGMQLEIGPCHRRYPVPENFRKATETFAGRARLDAEGNLRDYVAGLPFPPPMLDASDAGTRWAWNAELRHRAFGPVGSFRIVDMPSRIGAPEIYLGRFFFVRTGYRADLASSGYFEAQDDKHWWVAGGNFEEPFAARHLAWRQFRKRRALERSAEPDDTFVYVPTMRKPRRAASAWVDGVFTPRYRVSGDAGGGSIPFGSSEGGPTGSIQPTAGVSIAVTEHIRRGFLGLALRPNAYVWQYLGAREVLAPINATHVGYPGNPDRNFGESGLSVASDRWDLRYAVVIEGTPRLPIENVGSLKLYIDYQTQQPLYFITRRKNGLLLEVGILVSRFSGDTQGYPEFSENTPAHVFDPVAAVFYSSEGGGTGWRRESYDLRSVPVDPKALRDMTSSIGLVRGR